MTLALKVGQTDLYSEAKLVRLKSKYPELRFSVYCTLKNYGLNDLQIKKMYAIGTNNFQFFKNGHLKVLKEVRNWV